MFILNEKTKLLLFLLIFFFLFSFLSPINKASADVPVIDLQNNAQLVITNTTLQEIFLSLTGVLPGQKQDDIYTGMMMAALKTALKLLTDSIVTWVNGGFDGSPKFVTDTGQFLQDTADITIGDFLMNDPDLEFLCDPFKIQVKLAIGTQYGGSFGLSGSLGSSQFQNNIRCSFTDALGNIDTALMNTFLEGDFIGGGGWDSWLQITTNPQNNQIGASILAQIELNARLAAKEKEATQEASWGGGFMSWKKCESTTVGDAEGTYDEETGDTGADVYDEEEQRLEHYSTAADANSGQNMTGTTKQTCTIQTPGSVIANKINWADSSAIRELELADDINTILNAVAMEVQEKGMQSMSANGGLLGAGKKPDPATARNDYQNYLINLESQLQQQ